MKKYLMIVLFLFFESNKLKADIHKEMLLLGVSMSSLYLFLNSLSNSIDCQLGARQIIQDVGRNDVLNDIKNKCSSNVNLASFGLFISFIFFLAVFWNAACPPRLVLNRADQRMNGPDNV